MPGDPSKFARFVTAMVFQLLNRSPKTKSEVQVTGIPPSPPLYDRIDSDLVYLSLDIMDHAPHILYCIHHIIENTSQSISLSIIVLTLKYIDRIINYQIKTPKAGSEAHLFCICLILAQKQLDDHAFKNKTWSRITLIPVDVITLMERECLACLKFDLYVSHTEFSLWHSNIQKLALGWNQGYLKKSRQVPSLKKYNEKKSSNSAFKRKRVSKGMMSLSTM
jgi:hypothetical protein